jgi:hypothetical protein
MCGRVIQSSGPLRYAIVDGMNVHDSRVHNYPPLECRAKPGAARYSPHRQGGEISLVELTDVGNGQIRGESGPCSGSVALVAVSRAAGRFRVFENVS